MDRVWLKLVGTRWHFPLRSGSSCALRYTPNEYNVVIITKTGKYVMAFPLDANPNAPLNNFELIKGPLHCLSLRVPLLQRLRVQRNKIIYISFNNIMRAGNHPYKVRFYFFPGKFRSSKHSPGEWVRGWPRESGSEPMTLRTYPYLDAW